MKNTYFDLINQTYYFPQEGFELRDGGLHFHGLSIKHLIEEYGTPFKLTYLPKIGQQIKRAQNWFNKAIKANNYKGKYYYCYCTKCCHFKPMISEALRHDIHIETSSSFDIDLILRLFKDGQIDKDRILLHNGYKTKEYLAKIFDLQMMGFNNSIPILDNKKEIDQLMPVTQPMKIGLRVATELKPQSDYYTSRMGIQVNEVIDFYHEKIANNPNFELTMLHFFIDSGIKDNLYYWGEFQKVMNIFTEMKKICPTLSKLNIGGGLPIRNSLGFEYDYKYMINEIVLNIKEACEEAEVEEPDIFTEFGKYTVGESGAVIFSVLEQKKQNDSESWYLIDNSLMNTIPDAWSILEKFILLPINKWQADFQRVNIGGISCDQSDYYNSDDLDQQIFLPKIEEETQEPLYLGFFHTGAYQDAISGYGGIKHCLIPSPKHILVDKDKAGNFTTEVFRSEQKPEEMLEILGY